MRWATSPGDRGETPIRFINQTTRTLEIFWINYEGIRVYFYELAPGATYEQLSYPTHSWVVADRTTGECLAIFQNSSGVTSQARVTGVVPPTATPPSPVIPTTPTAPTTPGTAAPSEPRGDAGLPGTPVAPPSGGSASATPAPMPPKRLDAYVRFRARISATSVEFLKLVLFGPRNARVSIACTPACRLRRITVGSKGVVSLTSLVRGRRLRSGSSIAISVMKPNSIGRYFRYRVTASGISGVSCAISARSGKRVACGPA